jgi:tetratricopeptide (TPR) repeat protein
VSTIHSPAEQFRAAAAEYNAGRHTRAAALARPLLALPAPPEARRRVLHLLVHALIKVRVYEEAARHARELADLARDDADTQHACAHAMVMAGDFAGAERIYAALAAARPDDVKARASVIEILQRTGRGDEAAREIADCRRRFGDAVWIDVASAEHALRGGEADALLARLAAHGRDESLGPIDRVHALKAAANLLDTQHRCDEAFACAAAANALLPSDFDHAQFEATAEMLMRVWTPDRVRALAAKGSPSRKPALIVGMPRSGTTLLERLLSAHAGVRAAGELSDLSRITRYLMTKAGPPAADWPDRIAPEHARSAAAEYLRRLDEIDADAERVTDKMPFNVVHLGEFLGLFPAAGVLLIRRHPADICVSCFFRDFVHEHAYATSLAGLGRFYRSFVRLARHYRDLAAAVDPDGPRVLEVWYESLVAEPAAQTARLLEFLGLPADGAAADDARAPVDQRNARTLRADQIDRPVDTRSVERWRRYEAHLGPLLDALGDEMDRRD